MRVKESAKNKRRRSSLNRDEKKKSAFWGKSERKDRERGRKLSKKKKYRKERFRRGVN